MNVFGERMQEERKLQNKTQSELGKEIQMSQRKISRIETGQSEPTTNDIYRICKNLDVTSDYLIGLTNNYTNKQYKGSKTTKKQKIIVRPTVTLTNKKTLAKERITDDLNELKNEFWIDDDTINRILEDELDNETYATIEIMKRYNLI